MPSLWTLYQILDLFIPLTWCVHTLPGRMPVWSGLSVLWTLLQHDVWHLSPPAQCVRHCAGHRPLRLHAQPHLLLLPFQVGRASGGGVGGVGRVELLGGLGSVGGKTNRRHDCNKRAAQLQIYFRLVLRPWCVVMAEITTAIIQFVIQTCHTQKML